jgi:hypothetical protein
VVHKAINRRGVIRSWKISPFSKNQIAHDHGSEDLHFFATLMHIADIVQDDAGKSIQPPELPCEPKVSRQTNS